VVPYPRPGNSPLRSHTTPLWRRRGVAPYTDTSVIDARLPLEYQQGYVGTAKHPAWYQHTPHTPLSELWLATAGQHPLTAPTACAHPAREVTVPQMQSTTHRVGYGSRFPTQPCHLSGHRSSIQCCTSTTPKLTTSRQFWPGCVVRVASPHYRHTELAQTAALRVRAPGINAVFVRFPGDVPQTASAAQDLTMTCLVPVLPTRTTNCHCRPEMQPPVQLRGTAAQTAAVGPGMQALVEAQATSPTRQPPSHR
jgi:hypothetical protein